MFLQAITAFVRSVANLLFYGNFWIAACAAALSLQTELVFTGGVSRHPLHFFLAAGTLMIYALHRITGLKKVGPFTEKGRYFVIQKYKKHIAAYAWLGGLSAAVLFWFLPFAVQIALVVPALLSLGYVLPVLGGNKRLRDLDFLKIALVSGVWAWLTVVLPALVFYDGGGLRLPVLLTIERVLFVFLLTLPFDVRDLTIDGYTGVRTLPAILKKRGTRLAGAVAGGIALLLCAFNFCTAVTYTLPILLAESSSLLLALFALYRCYEWKDDRWYTGFIDGLMLLRFGLSGYLVWLFWS